MKNKRGGFRSAARKRPAPEPERVRAQRRVPIHSDHDIVTARQEGRLMAKQVGFSDTNLTLIATAISELARNILLYAREGDMTLGIVERNGQAGITVIASDRGPGIADLSRALEVGYSTSGSLGLGLPGVRRLMDDFEVESRVGRGTRVTARKWRP